MTTDKTLDNSLYSHLLSSINQALPLEYAIRAARQANPGELAELANLSLQIERYWQMHGVTPEEIRADSLVDLSWDILQVGEVLARRHGRVFPDRAFARRVIEGLSGIQEAFGDVVTPLLFPATGYYRICDLLNGNDILGLLDAVPRCLKDARRYHSKQDVELEKFVRAVREPSRLHPGIKYVRDYRDAGDRKVERFGIVVDTEMEISQADLHRLVREFLYQLAQRREALRPPANGDQLSRELIQSFLNDEFFGLIDPHKVTRLDGFIGPLAALHCWDLVRQYTLEGRRAAVKNAVDATLLAYPKGIRAVDAETIRANYYGVRSQINSLPFSGVASVAAKHPLKRRKT